MNWPAFVEPDTEKRPEGRFSYKHNAAPRLLSLFVRQDLLFVLAVLIEHEAVGGVLGVLGGGVVAVLATSAL
jgi:hypothetical protein